jgi:hypothetical protein
MVSQSEFVYSKSENKKSFLFLKKSFVVFLKIVQIQELKFHFSASKLSKLFQIFINVFEIISCISVSEIEKLAFK